MHGFAAANFESIFENRICDFRYKEISVFYMPQGVFLCIQFGWQLIVADRIKGIPDRSVMQDAMIMPTVLKL